MEKGRERGGKDMEGGERKGRDIEEGRNGEERGGRVGCNKEMEERR